MTRRSGGWRSGRRATRRPLRPGREENGADGFFLDIEGAAHLFGGEERLLADLSLRLEKNFGLPARLAIADTPGMAWALARFAAATPSPVLPSGQEAQALAPLPVEALRLSPDTCRTLRRLGFKTIGALLDKPRAPFAARFPAEFLRRIDQALGRIEEPLIPIVAPPVYHTLRYLLEPLLTQEAIVALASRLMHTLVQVLTRDDVGARGLRLSLYNVDGAVETIDIALTLPSRNVAHTDAPDRSQARKAGGGGRCRFRLRSGRACGHARGKDCRAAGRVDCRWRCRTHGKLCAACR